MVESDRNGNSKDNEGKWGSSPQKLVSKEVQDALKMRRDEQNLFGRFKNVAADALEQMSRQEEREGGKKKFQMGEEESKIIQNLNGVGLMEGAAAGMLTFLVLRRGPVLIGRWVRRRQMAQYQQYRQPPSASSPPTASDGYKLSNPTNSANPFQRAAHSRQEFPRSGSFFVRSIWFIFDVTLSLMMAASTSMAYTDTDKIRQQIIDMPLVQGTSLTSQALCDPIVQELRKIRKEQDPTFERLDKLNQTGSHTPASVYLDNIISFAENCERRKFVEHKLRQERGLSSDDLVDIPSPGVPRDSPRLILNDIDQEMVMYDDGTEEPISDPRFEHDMSWDSDYERNDKSF
ncbi:hypothetical protein IV203_029146 [Nitzschia inconspicua]|uniref:Uncharacterized protein n=1 Tax=Nitzschia inconspicua TaxID=303405 RepID=A0A9K3Q0H4_9STRA|nr:hypothetical protein IV203_029146 [Nitzschia inconspicua]